MLNAQTRAELTKLGLSANEVEARVSAMSWSDLHEARKRLRRSVGSLSEADASAFNAVGERIADISDEIDQREAAGEREPNATRTAAARRDSETAARREEMDAATRRFASSTPNDVGTRPSDWRPGSPLVLRPNDSAVAAYGRPEHGFGDLFRSAILGDHSGLSREASQNTFSGGAGGYVIRDQLWGSVLDLARNRMRIREAGATIIDNSSGQIGATNFPTLEEDPTAHWRGELTDIAESSAVFGNRNFQARTVAVYVTGSIEALEDSALLGTMVADTIAAQIAQQTDFACLAGNGVGQPLGVMNHDEVQTIDAGGTLNDYSAFARAVQKVREQNVEPGAFILSPSTLGHIDQLADTTGQPLRAPPSLQGRAMLDTNQVDRTDTSPITASAVVGEWASLFAVFRQGLVLEVSRTAGDSFKKLGWAARGYARLDAFPVRPTRFCKIVNLPAR